MVWWIVEGYPEGIQFSNFPSTNWIPWFPWGETEGLEKEKCTSHGVVHCTSKNQINQEQLQEKCRREVGVMSSTILDLSFVDDIMTRATS